MEAYAARRTEGLKVQEFALIKCIVLLTDNDVKFLAGALQLAKLHYDEIIELQIDDSMTKDAESDLKVLENIQRKIGIR